MPNLLETVMVSYVESHGKDAEYLDAMLLGAWLDGGKGGLCGGLWARRLQWLA